VIDWDIGGSGWTVSSLTGFRKNKNATGSDSDHSEAYQAFGRGEPLFGASDSDRQKDFSQEVTLSSPEDAPIRAKIGGYYFKQDFSSRDTVFQDPLLRTGSTTALLGGDTSQAATIRNRAVFGMVEWDITDALSITAELRHAIEKKTIIDRSSASATGAYIFAAGVSQPLLDQFGCTAALINRVSAALAPIPGCRVFDEGEFKGTDPRITIQQRAALCSMRTMPLAVNLVVSMAPPVLPHSCCWDETQIPISRKRHKALKSASNSMLSTGGCLGLLLCTATS
jgi:hypothetical protein